MKLIGFSIITTVSFLIGTPQTLSAEPTLRDTWHVYLEDDSAFGYVHTEVSRQQDGNYKFNVKTRLLLEILGQQSQTTTNEEYIVKPDLQPVSVHKTIHQDSGNIELKGRAEGNSLLLERTAYGITRKSKIKLSNNTIFRVCIPDWLKTRPQTALKLSVRVIDDKTLNTNRTLFQHEESSSEGKTWITDLKIGLAPSQGRIILDQKGFLLRQRFDVPKMDLRLSTKERAKQITHRNLNNRYLLMFPIDKNISHPNDLKSLTIKLKWKDIPWKEFQLEDERQHLVSHTEKDGQHEAVVKIGPISKSKLEKNPSLKDSELKARLAETLYIKPNNSQISQQALQWTKGAGSRIEAVQMLSKAVFDYLNGGTLIPETLSGPEVLQCRKGKCSEFSTLFASLARSVDIPTRIVLGDRMLNGNWIGHMWNEAYVGRWITVDATTNEVGNAPALLKFVHADSVGRTQTLRWALTQSLDISITAFDSNSIKSNTKLSTGIKDNTYTNTDFRCRITAVPEKWKMVDKSKPGQVLIRFQIPDHKSVQVHFVAYNLPMALDAATITGIRHGQFAARYKEYKLIQKTEQKLNGRKWQTLQFKRAAMKNKPGRMKTTEYIWHEGSSGYLINIIAKESDHDQLQKDFLKIVNSFEILKDKPKQEEKSGKQNKKGSKQ